MNIRKLVIAAAGAAVGLSALAAAEVAKADEQFIPLLVYRTGAYAPSGIPIANGLRDYYTLINKRDGGVGGVTITFEECETQYKTNLGVECYEKLKGNGPTGASLVSPFSTGITYQLIPKSAVDGVPILSMGYGRASSADGRVFKWVFNPPDTYWTQASAVIKYFSRRVGGYDKLKGVKIVHLYHNSAYGKEANPTLEILAKRYGYKLTLIPVDHPGQEQASQWRQIRRIKPDFVFMSGWGVMNQVAIKEAAGIRFPMENFVGNWWSGSDADVIPAGDGAKGYLSTTFHGAGAGFDVHKDIIKYVYGGDEAKAHENKIGEVMYNRAIVNAMVAVEGIRTAQAKFGKKSLKGEEIRWGLENLDITKDTLGKLGFKDMMAPLKITCADHETMGPIIIQKWDGAKWSYASEWLDPMRDVVRPLVEADAAAYAKENNITPRDCK